MKNNYLLLLVFSIFSVFAQEDIESGKIAESEMKSASKLLSMVVNPNTLNYNLTYQKLEFTVDPAVFYVSGKVTSTFTALSDMNTVTFDLYKKSVTPFTISSVKINNVAATYSYNSSHELVINLPTTLTLGTSATAEIVYEGAPLTSGDDQGFFTGTHSGVAVLWTLSEPYGARSWWPCKQDLNDKVEVTDIYITAPIAYTSVGNGLQQSRIENAGFATTHFKHNYPIPAYLIAIAVTNYQIFNQTGGTVATGTFPIVNYLYPEEFASVSTGTTLSNALTRTPDIINFFETKIGPYPYRNEKYGHARANLGGGMEHATVSFMNSWGRDLIAHEMAHQWFGDKITCGTWKDIWLNEGITEYMSGLVRENFDGNTAFTSWKTGKINDITSQTTGNLYLRDDQLSVDRIFSYRFTYNKGAMVTNMLRLKMGDTNFFQGLRNYLEDPLFAYGYAVTDQFRLKMEAIHGSSLQEFFQDWVYNEGYPIYNISAQNWNTGQVRLVVNQTQSDPSVSFFEMPVPVRVFGSGGQQMDLVLNNTSNNQVFIENVPFVVTSFVFDPNKNIISRNNTITLGTEDFELNSIKLYPNPTSSFLNLDLPNGVILKKAFFYNSLGQKIMESNANTQWNISNFKSGIYFINLMTDAGTKQLKFIKN